MGNTIEMSRAIVPKNVDNREVLKMSPCNVKEGFCEGERGMDDDVDCNQGEGRIDFSPLEVVLGTDLDRGGCGEAEGDDGFINGAMPKLALSSVSLKGTKLPVRPPVVVVGKRGEEDRRVGREGASGVFRGNN